MTEPDRKAAQDALGWLGLYNGVVDGSFRKTHARRDRGLSDEPQGAEPDGIVTPPNWPR